MTERWTSWHRPTTSTSAMADWNDGYMVDTVYTRQMFPDICPAWISMAAVLHGQPPLRSTGDSPLCWLDLGTGFGMSAAMVAATNQAEVWGVDFNPAHVEGARALVEKTELDNCHFIEASFEDLADDISIGPAEVDVIVVNGVYSWISEDNQQRIGEIVRRRLRPGGFAYVMYEVPLGWASMTPLTEALRLHAANNHRHRVDAFSDAAEAVAELAELGARSFPLPPSEADRIDSWKAANGFYAAHEYLGSNFRPLMVDEVARTMAQARCSLIGALSPANAYRYKWLPDGLRTIITDTDDPILRELLQDVIGERGIRGDLYRRGVAVSTPTETARWNDELRIMGLGKELSDEPVSLPIGGVTLDPEFHQPLIEALGEGPLDITRVLAIHPQWTRVDASTALALLVSGGYAAPAVHDEPSSVIVERCARFNDLIFAENRDGHGHEHLVASRIGTGVHVDSVALDALDVVRRAHETNEGGLSEGQIVERVIHDLEQLGLGVRDKSVVIDDPAEARSVVAERIRDILRRADRVLPELGLDL